MTHKASNFNPNHIFVDTNVLVGGYSGDARFQKDADCLHYLYSLTGKRLYISTLSVAQLISMFQKKKRFFRFSSWWLRLPPAQSFFTSSLTVVSCNPNSSRLKYSSSLYP